MSSNQYEAEQETKQQSHNNAVRELANSRNRLKEALTMAELDGVPPYRTVINNAPPNPNDIMGGFHSPPWSESLRSCHAAALEFWAEVKPYRANAMDKWQAELAVVNVPIEGEWTTEGRRHRGSIRRRGLDYKPVSVTLKDLGEWRFHQLTLVMESAEERKERAEKVFLPPAACNHVYQQLNSVLEEIGLLAEVREKEAHDKDPGVPNDVNEWKQYEEDSDD